MDRNICCPTKPDIPKGIWDFIRKIPALRYMLAPVPTVEDLYRQYSYRDIERNSFAYVTEENTFYIWRECEEHFEHYSWQPVKADYLSELFSIDHITGEDGDILVYDKEAKVFQNKEFNLFGLIEWTEEELKINKEDYEKNTTL